MKLIINGTVIVNEQHISASIEVMSNLDLIEALVEAEKEYGFRPIYISDSSGAPTPAVAKPAQTADDSNVTVYNNIISGVVISKFVSAKGKKVTLVSFFAEGLDFPVHKEFLFGSAQKEFVARLLDLSPTFDQLPCADTAKVSKDTVQFLRLDPSKRLIEIETHKVPSTANPAWQDCVYAKYSVNGVEIGQFPSGRKKTLDWPQIPATPPAARDDGEDIAQTRTEVDRVFGSRNGGEVPSAKGISIDPDRRIGTGAKVTVASEVANLEGNDKPDLQRFIDYLNDKALTTEDVALVAGRSWTDDLSVNAGRAELKRYADAAALRKFILEVCGVSESQFKRVVPEPYAAMTWLDIFDRVRAGELTSGKIVAAYESAANAAKSKPLQDVPF